jgi:hypothetical protein
MATRAATRIVREDNKYGEQLSKHNPHRYSKLLEVAMPLRSLSRMSLREIFPSTALVPQADRPPSDRPEPSLSTADTDVPPGGRFPSLSPKASRREFESEPSSDGTGRPQTGPCRPSSRCTCCEDIAASATSAHARSQPTVLSTHRWPLALTCGALPPLRLQNPSL